MEPLEAHLLRQREHSRDFFWHRVRWNVVSSYLPRGRPAHVVDVGAGIGLLGDFLLRDLPGSRYRFVEPIEALEADLTRRFGAQANLRDASFYDGDGFVALLDVLEHQRDDRGFLADLAAKMHPGATLLVTVPALRRLWSQWDVALGHFRRYDKAMMTSVVAGLPLRVRELSYLFPEMVVPALVRQRRQDEADRTNFPDLPTPVNELFYQLGSATARGRRRWPGGTSLLAVLEKAA